MSHAAVRAPHPGLDGATADYSADTVSVLLGNDGSADGTKTVEAQYRDTAANVLALSDDIVLDTVKPTTSDDAPSGWHDHAITVTLTATDTSGSGVAFTEYRLDGDPDWTTYRESIEITADGDHTLTYRSTDIAGNTEGDKTAHVKIDRAPSGSFSIDCGDPYTNSAAVALDSSVTDYSALEMRFRNAGGTWSAWEPYVASRAWTLPAGRIDYHYPAGTGPTSLNAVDLNNDGVLDIVTADLYAGTVSVLPGNGDGTFSARIPSPEDGNPWAVITGDLDGDGDQDVVAADNPGSGVHVLLGDGDGTFAAPVYYPAGTGPEGVALGDFDGDGDRDLVVANWSSDYSVSVLLGNGDGTFADKADYGTGSLQSAVAVGDFDGDGYDDVAAANGAAR